MKNTNLEIPISLFEDFISLLDRGVLITAFSFKIGDDIKYRFYFKDMENGFIYNPLANNRKGYVYYDTYHLGLQRMIEEANRYIVNKINNRHNE